MAKTQEATVKSAGKADQQATQAAANNVLTKALLALGKVIWATWTKEKLYVELGIREKTATKTGTRAAMLATAAHGYKQGQGRLLAMAVRQAMGLDPNVGGIDFPWLEKEINIRTITPLATVRLDAKTGDMRLMPVGKVKAPKVSAEVEAIKAARANKAIGKANVGAVEASKATNVGKSNAQRKAERAERKAERSDGPVTTLRMSDDELAAMQAAMADGAQS